MSCNEILSRRAIARDPAQEVEERRVIALEEDPETGHVAIPNGQHQRLVGHVACIGENLAPGKWLRESLMVVRKRRLDRPTDWFILLTLSREWRSGCQ